MRIEEKERIVKALRERLDEHNENGKAIQDEIASTCDRFAKEAEELEGNLNRVLEQEFAKETSRLQSALSDLTRQNLRSCPERKGRAFLRYGSAASKKSIGARTAFVSKQEAKLTSSLAITPARKRP